MSKSYFDRPYETRKHGDPNAWKLRDPDYTAVKPDPALEARIKRLNDGNYVLCVVREAGTFRRSHWIKQLWLDHAGVMASASDHETRHRLHTILLSDGELAALESLADQRDAERANAQGSGLRRGR